MSSTTGISIIWVFTCFSTLAPLSLLFWEDKEHFLQFLKSKKYTSLIQENLRKGKPITLFISYWTAFGPFPLLVIFSGISIFLLPQISGEDLNQIATVLNFIFSFTLIFIAPLIHMALFKKNFYTPYLKSVERDMAKILIFGTSDIIAELLGALELADPNNTNKILANYALKVVQETNR